MDLVSSRAKTMQRYFAHEAKYLNRQKANPYHKTTNPEGSINMGTSENKLTYDLLKVKFDEAASHEILKEHTQYFCCEGLESFRETIAEFFNYYMKPTEPIVLENLIVSNGCTPLIDAVMYCIADENEGVLIPAPFYGSFVLDLKTRARVVPIPVELSSEIGPGESKPFELSITRLENSLKKATDQGIQVRALLLCNPNNPLGIAYSEGLLDSCLQFAARHSLHIVVDEIYMLCGFKESCTVKNVLSVKNIPDKDRLHVLWGFSKDFGISGFRCGVLHTWNKGIYHTLSSGYTRFHDVPTPTQVLLTNLIKDKKWLDTIFIPTNKKRLQEAHRTVCDALNEVNIPFVQGDCGLFVWADFRQLLAASTFEEEMRLFDRFVNGGVFIFPGSYFCCPEPGWFRIVFAMDSDTLNLGLNRLKFAIEKVRTELEEKKNSTKDIDAQHADNTCTLLHNESDSHDQEASANSEALEDLVRTLHQQIQASDWLKENTAEKWMQENPDVAKMFLNSRTQEQ